MMNENKDLSTSDPREETIDILVSPKKKDPPQPKEEKKTVTEKKEAANPAAKPSSLKNTEKAPQKAPSKPSAKEPGKVFEKNLEKSGKLQGEKKAEPVKKSRTVSDGADRTRAIHRGDGLFRETSREKSESTRIGVVGAIGDGEKKIPTAEQKSVPSENKGEKSKKVTKEKKKNTRRGYVWWNSLYATVIRTVLYVAVVLGISATLSYYGINWSNDIFALVKDEVTATVTVPENATISEIADLLADNGIIQYPSVFRFYIGFKNRDTILEFKAGEYELKSTLNYDQLVSMMKDRKARSIVTITIPEGFTVDEIIDLFVSKGMGTREGFEYAINHFEYDYDFMKYLNAIELSSYRRYRLEGYLFPDTYDFYTDSKEIAIIDKLLANFDYRFEHEYYSRLQELNLNLDQAMTLASIIQMEGKYNSDFYSISGVFHNRLNSRSLKRLESDATVQYCLNDRKENLTYDDLAIDNPYNTYLYEGLPPSAIANPGWEAMMAMLYPEKNNFYYFVADTDGSTIFAETLPEHLKNVAAVADAKAKGGSVD